MKYACLTAVAVLGLLPACGCQKTSSTANAADLKQRVEHAPHPDTAADALQMLREGNTRFVEGVSVHPHESADYRAALTDEQHPFVTVLGCSDSRVTPVLIFDQGVGDMFVIRVAGNVVDEDVAGSIEYAVDHLHTPLIVVLGHENCGAVTAALHARRGSLHEPHEIETLLSHIHPALKEVDDSWPASQQVAAGVEANVRRSIAQLSRIPDLRESIVAGRVEIVGAIYNLHTGQISFLDEAPVTASR